MSRRGVLDNVPSSSIAFGLSLGKRQSNIEDHGFIAPSISRLKLSKTSFNRIDLCSYLPLSSIRVGTNVLTSSRLVEDIFDEQRNDDEEIDIEIPEEKRKNIHFK